MGEPLDLADLLAIAKLKKLRRRSISNPRWRDSRYLSLSLERRYLSWADDSPLEPKRLAARKALARYRPSDDESVEDLDGRWGAVVAAVDSLIAAAEQLQGHAIKETP